MWFGYLNRNFEERITVAVGADNGFNGEDMGQPEFFETRRQMFAFKVNVPATFPKDKDLVWTLKANGVTLKAFGCLWPVWEIDANTISANRGSRTAIDFDEPPNAAPRVVDPPPPQRAEVGKPLALTLSVVDDGNPKPRADRGARVAGIKSPAPSPRNCRSTSRCASAGCSGAAPELRSSIRAWRASPTARPRRASCSTSQAATCCAPLPRTPASTRPTT